MTDIQDPQNSIEPDAPEPGNLKFLRLLVTILTGVMILGVLVIIALLVIRLSDTGPSFPAEITLPAGATATAVTKGDGWYAVVTSQNEILIFNATTGALTQTIPVRTD